MVLCVLCRSFVTPKEEVDEEILEEGYMIFTLLQTLENECKHLPSFTTIADPHSLDSREKASYLPAHIFFTRKMGVIEVTHSQTHLKS